MDRRDVGTPAYLIERPGFCERKHEKREGEEYRASVDEVVAGNEESESQMRRSRYEDTHK